MVILIVLTLGVIFQFSYLFYQIYKCLWVLFSRKSFEILFIPIVQKIKQNPGFCWIPYSKRELGVCYMTQGAKPRALWWPQGGDGVGGGRFKRQGVYVCLRMTHVDVWQKPTHDCKAIILQLKIYFFKGVHVSFKWTTVWDWMIKLRWGVWWQR